MALRRLLSGWLIAVAALARSMALALERAAPDRPEPAPDTAPDPVMAALMERYPGAPAHWLAHLAGRTAQLAEAGEAPLEISSYGAAPTLFDSRAAEVTLPSATFRSDPPGPEAAPVLDGRRDRPETLWRRTEEAPRRRPRPVFAPVADTSLPASASRPDEAGGDIEPTIDLRPSPAWPVDPAADNAVAPAIRPTEVEGASEAPSESVRPKAARVPSRPRFVEEARTPSSRHSRRSMEPSEPSEPTVREPSIARDPPPPVVRTGPKPSWPFAGRSAARRRPIFSALTGSALRRRTDRLWDQLAQLPQATIENPVSEDASSFVESPRQAAAREPSPPAAPTRTLAPTRDDWRVWLEDQTPPPSAPQAGREPDAAIWSEARSFRPRRRTRFAPAPVSTTEEEAASPSEADDRWPRFPSSLFTAPPAAEVPSSRFEQLARDQEEGRWSV